jgi:hypothetical protein
MISMAATLSLSVLPCIIDFGPGESKVCTASSLNRLGDAFDTVPLARLMAAMYCMHSVRHD